MFDQNFRSQESLRLNQDDSDHDEDVDIAVTPHVRNDKSRKICCGQCEMGFCSFYFISGWYIIVSIFIFIIFDQTLNIYDGETAFFPTLMFLNGIGRLSGGCLGIYITFKLRKQILPNKLLIDIWCYLLLWIPIIFNTIYIIFSSILFFMYINDMFLENNLDALFEIFLGHEDSHLYTAYVLIGLIQIPAVLDVFYCTLNFYRFINLEIEEYTKYKIYGCPLFKCC